MKPSTTTAFHRQSAKTGESYSNVKAPIPVASSAVSLQQQPQIQPSHSQLEAAFCSVHQQLPQNQPTAKSMPNQTPPTPLSVPNNDTIIDMEFQDLIENNESNKTAAPTSPLNHQSVATGNSSYSSSENKVPTDSFEQQSRQSAHELPLFPPLNETSPTVGKLKASQLEAFSGKSPSIYTDKTNRPVVGKLKASHLSPFL